jgi:SAM-dependent methyltransferase
MKSLIFLSLLILITGCRLTGQALDVPYVPTPTSVVEKMLEISNVGPGDYVIDLGSGDGRIVIAAAQRGAVGHGIDLNPQRVREAEENAMKAGVSERVIFIEGDLFKAEISQATVITMYLLSSVNLRLRSGLFEKLRPGTRIVSHSFSMGEWEADEEVRIDGRNVYYWVIPADVMGQWEWQVNGEKFLMDVKQAFQKIYPQLRAGNRQLDVRQAVLVGERITFSVVDHRNGNHYVFNGLIDNDRITGTTQIRNDKYKAIENWSATLVRR